MFTSHFYEKIFNGIDLLNHEIKFVLLDNTYYYQSSHQNISDISSYEISGFGYARQTLTNKTFTSTLDLTFFSFDPIQISASGGDLTPAYYALYDEDETNDPLICYGFCDVNSPSGITISDGQIFTLTPDPIFGFLSLQ